jgi:hypothetical protein
MVLLLGNRNFLKLSIAETTLWSKILQGHKRQPRGGDFTKLKTGIIRSRKIYETKMNEYPVNLPFQSFHRIIISTLAAIYGFAAKTTF